MNARKILLQTMENLGKTKSIDKITVQEILEEAEVSRNTFYKYFQDKYALANAVYESHVTTLIGEEYNGHNWLEVLTRILSYLLEHFEYYIKLWNERDDAFFVRFLIDYSFQFCYTVYCHNHEGETITKAKEYSIWFATAGSVMMLDRWIRDGCKIPVDQFAQEMLSHLPREFYEYME